MVKYLVHLHCIHETNRIIWPRIFVGFIIRNGKKRQGYSDFTRSSHILLMSFVVLSEILINISVLSLCFHVCLSGSEIALRFLILMKNIAPTTKVQF